MIVYLVEQYNSDTWDELSLKGIYFTKEEAEKHKNYINYNEFPYVAEVLPVEVNTKFRDPSCIQENIN